jgi:hypothetical protein
LARHASSSPSPFGGSSRFPPPPTDLNPLPTDLSPLLGCFSTLASGNVELRSTNWKLAVATPSAADDNPPEASGNGPLPLANGAWPTSNWKLSDNFSTLAENAVKMKRAGMKVAIRQTSMEEWKSGLFRPPDPDRVKDFRGWLIYSALIDFILPGVPEKVGRHHVHQFIDQSLLALSFGFGKDNLIKHALNRPIHHGSRSFRIRNPQVGLSLP